MSHANPHPRPSRPPRRWPRLLAITLVIILAPWVLVATTIAATGTATVHVRDDSEGLNLWVPVPALLIDLAAVVLPRVLPEDELARVRAEIEPFRPALIEAVRAIEDCPSGVLVEVHDGEDHVRVSKNGRSFRVMVDSADVDVRVSVPARVARRALQAFDLI